ncbi:hypothetical protein AB6848_13605 [Serratia proteamaculans]|jgi:putative transposase|uniref:hypothetical protein n=1 Tax=Serratia proteamaculans TaxID=28151 RepID=UPI0009F7D884|nr:hypothetical protein [Serratia proteamaculans]SMB41438.1 hypothetical protein SPRA44_480064 [Serratia proteamaculans]
MKRISPERKNSVLAKLLPPYNMTVAAVAQMEGIYQAARMANPGRWSGRTRNWQRQEVVMLNPERGKQAA